MTIDAQIFWQRVRQDIPLLVAMDTSLLSWDGQRLCLGAPLAANINDKHTAFAGSLATLATVAGWATLTLWTQAHQLPCLVAVAESTIRYKKPVMADFQAIVHAPDAQMLDELKSRISSHGRGRISIDVVIESEGIEALRLQASYALWPS